MEKPAEISGVCLPAFFLRCLLLLAAFAVSVPAIAAQTSPPCSVCRAQKEEVLLKYHDGTTGSFCSLRCAFGSIAAYREKDVVGIMMREHAGGAMIDAKKAFWVVGGTQPAVFSARADAERFALKNRGRVETYDSAMKAFVSGLYGEIAKAHRGMKKTGGDDRQTHPECVYCGMDRKKYAYSRMLIVYEDGSSVGLCSIHCAAIDLALKVRSAPAKIMAGAYDSHRLIDAEKAVWVLGGSKQGVMSIRGKWAFEKKKDAEEFIRKFGGAITGFPEAMQAAFEDMWEILK